MGSAPLILVVEDRYDDGEVISRMLEHHGYEVLLCGDGNSALKALENQHPALIVMDIAMPGLDGWETLSAIRSNPANADIPVLATTAFYSYDVAEDIEAAGFDDFYPKPFHLQSFLEKVNALLVR